MGRVGWGAVHWFFVFTGTDGGLYHDGDCCLIRILCIIHVCYPTGTAGLHAWHGVFIMDNITSRIRPEMQLGKTGLFWCKSMLPQQMSSHPPWKQNGNGGQWPVCGQNGSASLGWHSADLGHVRTEVGGSYRSFLHARLNNLHREGRWIGNYCSENECWQDKSHSNILAFDHGCHMFRSSCWLVDQWPFVGLFVSEKWLAMNKATTTTDCSKNFLLVVI